MKPIAKAMTVAWSAAALITAASATASARKAGVTPLPGTGQRQTIAAQAASMDGEAPPPPQLIPIGANMHLDARILAADQTK